MTNKEELTKQLEAHIKIAVQIQLLAEVIGVDQDEVFDKVCVLMKNKELVRWVLTTCGEPRSPRSEKC